MVWNNTAGFVSLPYLQKKGQTLNSQYTRQHGTLDMNLKLDQKWSAVQLTGRSRIGHGERLYKFCKPGVTAGIVDYISLLEIV